MSPNQIKRIVDDLIHSDSLPTEQELAELSDLDQTDLGVLRQDWEKISVDRRRSLLENLGSLADNDFMLSYEAINRFALSDHDHEVRCRAIQNLWESEDHHLIPIFLEALASDSSARVRAAAADALGPFVLLGENQRFPGEILAEVERALVSSFQGEVEQTILGNCIRSLGFSSNEVVRELIFEAFNSEQEEMVEAALIAMGRSANSQYTDHVLMHLASPSPKLRREAVVAAGELEIQAAIPELSDLLNDVDIGIRHAAIWSLGQIGGKQAKQILIDLSEAVEDESETNLIDDALSNLEFVDGSRDLLRFGLEDNQDSSD